MTSSCTCGGIYKPINDKIIVNAFIQKGYDNVINDSNQSYKCIGV